MTSWLDNLASRRGFTLTMGVICAVTLSAGVWFHRSTSAIEETGRLLNHYSSSRIHAALNDLTRLAIELPWRQEIANDAGTMSTQDFMKALDILHARAEHMEARLVKISDVSVDIDEGDYREALEETGANAVAAIRKLVDFGDTVVGQENLPAALQDTGYRQEIEAARFATFRYLDHVIKLESRLVALQGERINALTRTSYVFLVVITIAGAASLLLLRAEVVARKKREQAETRAHRLAFYDTVTGLANRVHFRDRVEESLQTGKKGALVIIDFDGFKDINDRHGHAVGDDFLKMQGARIEDHAQKARGIAARLGGDEFAVYLETDDVGFLEEFCGSLIAYGTQPLNIGNLRLLPNFSVGLATTTQLSVARAVEFGDLMRVADFALYSSKANGKGRFTLYDSDLELVYSERRKLQKALPLAIQNGDLEVFLQPKVSLSTDRVKSFEALVRWRRDGEIVPPGEFIEIAEETGRVIELDQYVLQKTVEILAEWNASHGTDFSVSVNLSGLHFRGENDLEFVAQALKKHGLPPENLTLEITETVQLGNWKKVGGLVASLRELGCRISIDDFGS
ncbi:MAG: EAL domain-containing protein, partial [Boseongicola sp.]|nr:EAL domain-containing protein [Boseongicola sp.]